MSNRMKTHLVALYGCALFTIFPIVMFGCPSTPPAPPIEPADVTTATVVEDAAPDVVDIANKATDFCPAACANLIKLGCPEGLEDAGQGCTSVCEHTQSSKLFNMKASCLAAAKTKTEVKACGSVTCQ